MKMDSARRGEEKRYAMAGGPRGDEGLRSEV